MKNKEVQVIIAKKPHKMELIFATIAVFSGYYTLLLARLLLKVIKNHNNPINNYRECIIGCDYDIVTINGEHKIKVKTHKTVASMCVDSVLNV